jgi:hypothetical protein
MIRTNFQSLIKKLIATILNVNPEQYLEKYINETTLIYISAFL